MIQFEGTIIDTSGLPGGFVMRLGSWHPAVYASSTKPTNPELFVRLDGDEKITLKLRHLPEVGTDGLLVGLQATVVAAWPWPTDEPDWDRKTVDTDAVRIRPGRLDGIVIHANEAARTLLIGCDRVDRPFGGGPLTFPVLAALAGDVRIKGDATSVNKLFDLWRHLPHWKKVEVRVYGIADRRGGIYAHSVDVDVKYRW
jgi:hypothetical protein